MKSIIMLVLLIGLVSCQGPIEGAVETVIGGIDPETGFVYDQLGVIIDRVPTDPQQLITDITPP